MKDWKCHLLFANINIGSEENTGMQMEGLDQILCQVHEYSYLRFAAETIQTCLIQIGWD